MRALPGWRTVTFVVAMCASVSLQAQYYAPAALERASSSAGIDAPARRDDVLRAAVAGERGRVSHDVLVGAAIGAGVGIVAVAIAASGPGVTDHSEDGIFYVGGAAFGAGVGMLVGLIVGLSRD